MKKTESKTSYLNTEPRKVLLKRWLSIRTAPGGTVCITAKKNRIAMGFESPPDMSN